MSSMPHLPTLHWDYRNRLTNTDLGGGGNAYYSYDGDGERVRSVVDRVGHVSTRKVSTPGWERIDRLSAGALVSREEQLVVSAGAQVLAVVAVGVTDSGSALPDTLTLRYQHDDHLGSCLIEVDQLGAIITFEEYYPYGATAYRSGRARSEALKKLRRFTGKRRAPETALFDFGSRQYAAWLGRWITPDPAGVRDGPSSYSMARGDPVRLRDPDGTQSEEGLTSPHTGSSRRDSRALQRGGGAAPVIGADLIHGADVREAYNAARLRIADYAEKLFGQGERLTESTAETIARATYRARNRARTVSQGRLAGAGFSRLATRAVELLRGRVPSFESLLGERLARGMSKIAALRDIAVESARRGNRLVKYAAPAARAAGLLASGVGVVMSALALRRDLASRDYTNATVDATGAVGGSLTLAGGAAGGITATGAIATGTAAGVAAAGGLVLGAFEVGWGAGRIVESHLSDETRTAIGGTIDEVVSHGGWRELYRHPFGIGL